MRWDEVRKLTRDDLLRRLGLEQRRAATDWILPGLGVLATGVLLGAGLGLLYAPRPGRKLRREISQRLNDARERAMEVAGG